MTSRNIAQAPMRHPLFLRPSCEKATRRPRPSRVLDPPRNFVVHFKLPLWADSVLWTFLYKEILVNSRIRTVFLLSSAVFLLLQLAVAQAPMGPPPFSADMQMTSTRNASGPRDMNGKIYFGQGHMRMDMQGGPGGGQSIIITDFKTQTTDILMPAQQMYMEHHGRRH